MQNNYRICYTDSIAKVGHPSRNRKISLNKAKPYKHMTLTCQQWTSCDKNVTLECFAVSVDCFCFFFCDGKHLFQNCC